MADRPIINTLAGGARLSVTELNDNFDTLASAIEACLGRSGVGESPNSITANVDMDLHKIVNLGDPTTSGDAVNKSYGDANYGGAGVIKAENHGDYAEEWANKAEDSLISTAAGGDGVDDYSALHQANKASASASAAATSESNAATSESNAATSESNAATSEANAAATYDNFDDRYLGAKASDPTLDNDGDALLTGALYFNTTVNGMKMYTGTSWEFLTSTNDATSLDGIDSLGFVQFPASTGLKVKVIDIGDWDMNLLSSKTVAHSLALGDIRNVSAIIRADGGNLLYASPTPSTTGADVDFWIKSINSTSVSLERRAGGQFDGTPFDQTSFNRGWVTIWYTS